jgi:hypothetical protein
MMTASCEKRNSRREEEHSLYHSYADCLLKNMSTKDNKYVVHEKLELVVSENLLQNQSGFYAK